MSTSTRTRRRHRDASHRDASHRTGGARLVLAGLLVRRRGLRRALYVVAVTLALLVGLDRIFLGVPA